MEQDYKFDFPAFMAGACIFIGVICIGASLFFFVEYGNKQELGLICLISGLANLVFSGLLKVLTEIRDNLKEN